MDNTEKLLRAAVRDVRNHLIEQRDLDSVPAAVDAWNGAVRLATALMEAHDIPLEEPLPEQVDITPALIERLLDEAELSPGSVTPGARAMLTVLRWLYVRQPENEKSDPVNIWIARAASLYDDERSGAPPVAPTPPAEA